MTPALPFRLRPALRFRTLRVALLALTALCCTSCFNIEEEIYLNRDGSGRYAISVDMSAMMEMMSAFMSQEESGETDMFGSLDSTLEAQASALRGMAGISNVSHSREEARFKLLFDFRDVSTLNRALQETQGASEQTGGLLQNSNFTWTPKSFERAAVDMKANMENAEIDEQSMEMARMFLADAKYKTILHLPGSAKKMTNKDAVISADKRTVTFDATFLDLLDGKVQIGNKVSFKPQK
jgi:hypothetical protein